MTAILEKQQSKHVIKGLDKNDMWMLKYTHWCDDFKAGDVRDVSLFSGHHWVYI